MPGLCLLHRCGHRGNVGEVPYPSSMPRRFISPSVIERIAADVLESSGTLDARDSHRVDIVAVAHSYGARVQYVQFDPPTVSARVSRVGTDSRFTYRIEINASESEVRRRFSIAHELAHVILHDDRDREFTFTEFRAPLDSYPDTQELYKEVQANMLGAALLMPQSQVTQFWRKRQDVDDLAGVFEVSRETAFWRLNNLNLLSDE